jgi:hypothetical protein
MLRGATERNSATPRKASDVHQFIGLMKILSRAFSGGIERNAVIPMTCIGSHRTA